MVKEFKLPELGENIESADIINVLVKVGDRVEKEQSIIEIETDKATIEVPSSVEGVVKEVLVKTGDNVKVGQTIIKVDEAGTGVTKELPAEEKTPAEKKEVKKVETKSEEKPKEKKPAASSGKKEIVEFKVPDLGENIESADVIAVLVKPGDVIEKDQGVIEIETDKATIEVPSSVEGKVVEVLIKPGDKAKAGDVILRV